MPLFSAHRVLETMCYDPQRGPTHRLGIPGITCAALRKASSTDARQIGRHFFLACTQETAFSARTGQLGVIPDESRAICIVRCDGDHSWALKAPGRLGGHVYRTECESAMGVGRGASKRGQLADRRPRLMWPEMP